MSSMKVWPLVPGLLGTDAAGHEIELTPGRPGWMEEKAALKLAAAGDLQIMAGIRPQDLKVPRLASREVVAEPELEDEPPTKPQTYNRRDMRARR